MEKISVIIPTYNGGKRLFDTAAKVNQQCHNLTHLFNSLSDYEIIFVDDGSTDDTQYILSQIRHKYPHVRSLSYRYNAGKGYAVRTGLLAAKHDICVILDDDMSVRPKTLVNIDFGELHTRGIIKGQRIQVVKQPLLRIVVGKVWKSLVYLKTGIFADTQCPFWVINLPKDFYIDLRCKGFAFDVEILYKAKNRGYRIRYQPVFYFNERGSRVTFKKTAKMFMELLRIKP